MNRLTLAIGLALLCAGMACAQETTVVVKDPDPPTPAIQQTTTTTTTEHRETVTPPSSAGSGTVHHAVRRHRVHRASVAYHRPVEHDSSDTQTTTKSTVFIPPHEPTTVVSEHADGSVTVSPGEPATQPEPSGQDDGQP